MITTSSYRIAFPGTADALWNYEPCAGPGPVAVRPPEFEIEGQAVTMALRDLRPG